MRQRVGEALCDHFAADADSAGFPGASSLLRKETLWVRLRAQRTVLPLITSRYGRFPVNGGHMSSVNRCGAKISDTPSARDAAMVSLPAASTEQRAPEQRCASPEQRIALVLFAVSERVTFYPKLYQHLCGGDVVSARGQHVDDAMDVNKKFGFPRGDDPGRPAWA
jgi:hypothetical protein